MADNKVDVGRFASQVAEDPVKYNQQQAMKQSGQQSGVDGADDLSKSIYYSLKYGGVSDSPQELLRSMMVDYSNNEDRFIAALEKRVENNTGKSAKNMALLVSEDDNGFVNWLKSFNKIRTKFVEKGPKTDDGLKIPNLLGAAGDFAKNWWDNNISPDRVQNNSRYSGYNNAAGIFSGSD